MNILKVTIKEQKQGSFVATLEGPIDTYTHEQFNYYLERILKPSTKSIILDMNKVDYISSMGIGSLFKIRKFAKQHKAQFLIIGLQPQVKKVLDMVQAMPAESLFKDIKEMDEYLDAIQKKNGENLS